MRLQQLDTELRNRGLKLTFREKQSLLSQSGPISEVLENYLNPPQSPQLPELQNGGSVKPLYVNSANDPRYQAFLDSADLSNNSLHVMQEEIRTGNMPSTTIKGTPVRTIEDLANIDGRRTRLESNRNFGVNVVYDPKGIQNNWSSGRNPDMPRTGLRNNPVISLEGPEFMSMEYHTYPKQQVIIGTEPLKKRTYTGIDPISRYRLPERQIEEVQIPSMPAVTSGNIQRTVQKYNTRKGNLRYNRSTREWEQIPYGYMNKGDNRGRIEP